MTLEELLEASFAEVIRGSGEGEVFVDCCFCPDGDSKHRLGINTNTGVAHCFKCDFTSGNRESTVNAKRSLFNQIAEATSFQGEDFSLEEGEEDTKSKKGKSTKTFTTKLPEGYEPLWRDVKDPIAKKALRYLRTRNVSKEQIEAHAIGFCAAGKYAYRIVFPVIFKNEIHGFVCRDLTGKAELRYLNSDGIKTLYNVPAKEQRKKTALLVEGIFDVLSCEHAELKCDILGGLGSKLTSRQLKILKTYNKVTLWPEPDRAGIEGTIKRAKTLLNKRVAVAIVMPLRDIGEDTDPGAMDADEIKQRFRSAVLYSKGVAQIMRYRLASIVPPARKEKYVPKGQARQANR